MNADAWIALLGSVVVGVAIRVSNVVVAWLSRVLGVEPPEPIPTPTDDQRPTDAV